MPRKPVFILLASILAFLGSVVSAQVHPTMNAHFINVGQGDATLLEFPCGAVLIDAGAQGEQYEKNLIRYLDNFFERRSDLNKTLDLVIITHAHLDHNLALEDVAKAFHIKKYIDNGLKVGSGKKNQNWLRDNCKKMKIAYASYSFEKITKPANKKGLSDTIIDPICCEAIDPEITILSGSFTRKPADWSTTAFSNNGNNHSVVVKVVFGKASFLFTGDLETEGISKLLQTYDPTVLDADILRVGHHGAANATTLAYLNAVKPSYAIISCGKWNYGKKGGLFNTYNYGHPRINILDQLAAAIPAERDSTITIKAASASKKFVNYKVSKKIYATAWDDNIVLEANDAGRYKILKDRLKL